MGWAERANKAGVRNKSVGTPNPPRRWRPWHDTGTTRVVRGGSSKTRQPFTTKPDPGKRRARRRMRNSIAKESRRRNRGS
jgi:hypothetical protein